MLKLKQKVKNVRHLIISVLLFSIPLLIFFPSTYLTIDEHDYINNAKLLITSGLKTDCDLDINGQWKTNLGYCISKYNIGTSIFFIPSAIIGDWFVSITILLIFIFGSLVFYLLLKHYKLDERLIYLFVLFPAFSFYARTALSELISMALILLIFYLLLKLRKAYLYQLLIGVTIFFAILTRYTNLIPIAIIGIYFFYQQVVKVGLVKTLKHFWILNISVVVGIALILLINNDLYGEPLRSGYYFSSEEGFSTFENFFKTFFNYIFLINFIYPLALIGIFATRLKDGAIFLLVSLTMIILYSLLKNSSFPGKFSDLLLGLRFLIPIYPFILLSYFDILNRFKSQKSYNYLLFSIVFILIIINLGINLSHYIFLQS